MKKIMAFALCLTLLLSAFAGGAVAEEDPVVIENMGRTTTYEEAPETAVALSYSIAEIMVALGLEDKIVAIAPSMYILDQVSEEYRETVGSFPVLEGIVTSSSATSFMCCKSRPLVGSSSTKTLRSETRAAAIATRCF